MACTMVCRNPSCPDRELHGVQGEYSPGTATCPRCGEPLSSARDDQPAATSALERPGADEPRLVPLCAPRTSAELAVVKSLLQAEGIYFFVHNEHFGSLEVGPFIPLLNVRTVLVPAGDLDRARGLLIPDEPAEADPPGFHWTDRLRVLAEGLLLGWIIPNRRPVLPPADRREH